MSQAEKQEPTKLTDEEKLKELNRMKLSATGLLAGVTLIFLVMVLLPVHNFWTELVQATAEAAMVGAMADWFAVTALFRHPMGLKIPHTAIIPTSKDQIGERLGQFFQHNFLTGDAITNKLQSMNIAGRVAAWLKTPSNKDQLANIVSKGLAGIVRAIDDESVHRVIRNAIENRLGKVPLTPVLGKFLENILTDNKRKHLIRGIMKMSGRLLKDYEIPIRIKIAEETPWWFPAPIDDKIYDRIVTMISQLKDNLEVNHSNPLYEQFDNLIDQLINDLKHSEAFIERGEMMKTELLDDTLSGDLPIKVWHTIKSRLILHEGESSSATHEPIARGLMEIGEALSHDLAMQDRLNNGIETGIRHLINQYGDEIGKLIAHTVKGWDGESTAQRIELQVGKDLQYIRINGTIIGGLVGLFIHLFSVFIS